MLCSLGALFVAHAEAQGALPAGDASQPAVSPTHEQNAREHFKRGEEAYAKGDYTGAVQAWQAAYAADPRPRIQYNLYQAYERSGQLAEAVDALQRYISGGSSDDPYFANAAARLAALQQRLQATGLRLTGGAAGATINIDGQDWGLLPRPDRIGVAPGNHRVIVTLEGYQKFVANVVVTAAQIVEVPVTLEPATATAAPGAPSAAPVGSSVQGPTAVPLAAEQAHKPRNVTAFYITSAVLGAGAVGSAIWLVNRATELRGCSDLRNFCPKKDAVTTQRTIAIATTAVLGAAAVGSLVYALVAGSASSEHASACTFGVAAVGCSVRF